MIASPLLCRRAARLGLAALLAGAVAGCGHRAGGPPPRPPSPVQTVKAVSMDTPRVIVGFGVTSERASVDVVPQVSGVITSRLFEDGAIVTNGQPLYEIDPRDYRLRVQQIESQLAADKAGLALARATFRRSDDLHAKRLVSDEDHDTAKARMDAAEALVLADESALSQARLNLARCTVTAPLAGICSRHYLDEGNLAAAGVSRLTNIRSYDPINVDFSLPERHLPALRAALQRPPVRIEITPRGATNRYAGTLVFLENAVSPQTGTIGLRGCVPNADLRLWASQFVEVRVFASVEPEAVMVPEGALQYGKIGTYVYTVKNENITQTVTNIPTREARRNGATETVVSTNFTADVVSLRPVQTGLRYDDLIQIQRGVAPGERVVVLGQLRIYPGAFVTDLAPAPQPAK